MSLLPVPPSPSATPALITGGSRGIGLHCARALGLAGHPVVLAARSQGVLQDAVERLQGEGIRALGVVADVSQSMEVARLFGEARTWAGSPLILVNNAGAAESAPFHRTDGDLLNRMMNANFFSTWHCSQAALPAMMGTGWGRIIQVSSTAGLRGHGYVSAYCASKHAVVGLTRALAVEVARKGITVNAVCPGYVDTPMVEHAVSTISRTTGREPEDARKHLESLNPQARLVTPEEVAALVLFLTTQGAASINGQALGIDGGATA